MMDASTLLRFLAFLTLTLVSTAYKDLTFTFVLPAGTTECFFQPVTGSESMEVDYQVIGGSGLDVSFTLVAPSGYRLISDFRKSDNTHLVAPGEVGDYRLCFDNSFSKMSEKIVFFGLILRPDSQVDEGRAEEEWAGAVAQDDGANDKLQGIRMILDSVNQRMDKSLQVLVVLRAFEARDRHLLEGNLWSVSFWSCVNLLVMLGVAAAQIYTVRRLFDGTSRSRT